MNKTVIQTNNAPKSIGIYSQGIIAGEIVFVSGQIAINPDNGQLIDDNFTNEVRQVLVNLDAVLKEGGSSLNSTVKLTVFLTDFSYFSKVNEVFKTFFRSNPPARSAIEVTALPMNARVEIEAIGIVE